jgi:alpha-L-fucosidase
LILTKNNTTVQEIAGTTIGKKRILTFPAAEIDAFKVVIEEAKGIALISEVAAYKIDDGLVEK